MQTKLRALLIGSLGVGASLVAVSGAAEPAPERVLSGRAQVYENLSPESLEHVSSSDRIKAVTRGNTPPTEIWRVLEHGEKVECLDCIPYVAELLYDDQARTREISAWWLRRRIFGVFGEGEVYAQVVDTLNDPSQPESHRARAADALGEFLTGAGVPHVSKAALDDPSPLVRKSAVLALKRLNSQGEAGELAQALGDGDVEVRLAALDASIGINVFTGVDQVAARIGDESPRVRRRAAQALGVMRVGDAVMGLVALTAPDTEPDADVRAAAVAALGKIGDSGARAAVEAASNDPDGFVRDAARIALRRL